jgi:predicted transposase YdaD
MAVDECINEDVLREFLLENKAEVVRMFLTEYNEKQTLENMYNDGVEVGKGIGKEKGIEIGKVQGIEFGERRKLIEMVYKKIKKGKTVEEIAGDLEENIEVVKQIYGNINAVGINKNLEVIIEQLTMK